MKPLTPDDVQQALDSIMPGATIFIFEESTATSQLAAEVIGCDLGQIVKSLAFIVDDTPVLVLASGDQRVDTRKLADLFEVSRKQVKVASAQECVEIFGYEPGGVPPVGHRGDFPTLIDDSLGRYKLLYAAGGAPNAIFPIQFQQLVVITGGEVADVREE